MGNAQLSQLAKCFAAQGMVTAATLLCCTQRVSKHHRSLAERVMDFQASLLVFCTGSQWQSELRLPG